MVEEVQKKVDFLKRCSSRLARFCHITQKPFFTVFYVSPSSLHLLHFSNNFLNRRHIFHSRNWSFSTDWAWIHSKSRFGCSSRLARFCHITQKPFLTVFYVSPSSQHLLDFSHNFLNRRHIYYCRKEHEFPLWQKKSNGWQTLIFFSIFDFRFSIFDFRFWVLSRNLLVIRFSISFDFRFSIFDLLFLNSICQRSEYMFLQQGALYWTFNNA